jgi:hypothetical protein
MANLRILSISRKTFIKSSKVVCIALALKTALKSNAINI